MVALKAWSLRGGHGWMTLGDGVAPFPLHRQQGLAWWRGPGRPNAIQPRCRSSPRLRWTAWPPRKSCGEPPPPYPVAAGATPPAGEAQTFWAKATPRAARLSHCRRSHLDAELLQSNGIHLATVSVDDARARAVRPATQSEPSPVSQLVMSPAAPRTCRPKQALTSVPPQAQARPQSPTSTVGGRPPPACCLRPLQAPPTPCDERSEEW